jgi:DNA polymerase
LTIHLDFETYSLISVIDLGAFRYAADPSTEILCASYAIDRGPVKSWTLFDIDPPEELNDAIKSGMPVTAHNAQFEYSILRYVGPRYGWATPRADAMRCTSARSAYVGLPRSLAAAVASAGLSERKDTDGKRLVAKFCIPKRKKIKGGGIEVTRVHPGDDPEDFKNLVAYNVQDVIAERGLDDFLPELPNIEQIAFRLDSILNRRGIPLDLDAIRGAIRIMSELMVEYEALTDIVTGGLRPTQRDKLLDWLNTEGLMIQDLQRETLDKLMLTKDLPDNIKNVLEMRLEAGRAAPKKLQTMLATSVHGRAHGMLRYFGAHTGRWTGAIVQPQNLPRGELKEKSLEAAFRIIPTGNTENFRLLFDQPAAAITSCIRGFIAPKPGRELIVVDFSAIEARVLVWLAGQENIRAAYEKDLDLYKWMASQLYSVPIAEVTSEQRRIGKNLILGCGFQLGANSFIDYCARAGSIVTESFAVTAVGAYRRQHPKVVNFWYDIENAAIRCVRLKKPTAVVTANASIQFDLAEDCLRILLPSGRHLYYRKPFIRVEDTYRGPQNKLYYMAALGAGLVRNGTYGGKLVENIVQAIARDLMVLGMDAAEREGYPVILTVHDEIVAEVPAGTKDPQELERIVSRRPSWGKTLPIGAKGFRTHRYRKD